METDFVLCKESAAEFLGLSNGHDGDEVCYYENDKNIDYIIFNDVKCTSINQTINDLLSDSNCDEQTLIESLSNFYYRNNESFKGLTIHGLDNQIRFQSLKETAITYYDD